MQLLVNLTGQNQLPSPEEAKKIKLKPKTWPKVDAVVAKISVSSLEEKKAAARGETDNCSLKR